MRHESVFCFLLKHVRITAIFIVLSFLSIKSKALASSFFPIPSLICLELVLEKLDEELNGFDVASCATNHMLDRGAKGALFTANILADNGIKSVGINEDGDISNNCVFINTNGIRVAFLSYTYGTNGIPNPEDNYFNKISLEKVEKAVEEGNAKEAFISSLSIKIFLTNIPEPTSPPNLCAEQANISSKE